MMAGRPSESVIYNLAKRKVLLEKFDELQAMGTNQRDASKMIGYNYSTVKTWLRQREVEEMREAEAKRLTMSGGSFSSALERLRAGYMVRRRDASWFLQIVDNKICLYLLDGAGVRKFSRVASFGSADVLAMDWELYAG
jgi:hypothetical protein